MGYETKDMTGALFANQYKERDNQPDYTGNVKIEGKMFRLAGWKQTPRGGGDVYLSISVTSQEEYDRIKNRGNSNSRQTPRPSAQNDYADDDIPF